jgi:hypothetical protein
LHVSWNTTAEYSQGDEETGTQREERRWNDLEELSPSPLSL